MWPDGSLSKDGLTAYHRLVLSQAVDAVSHPSMQALLQIKWRRFVHACFIQDLLMYFFTLMSISWVGIVFPNRKDSEVRPLARLGPGGSRACTSRPAECQLVTPSGCSLAPCPRLVCRPS